MASLKPSTFRRSASTTCGAISGANGARLENRPTRCASKPSMCWRKRGRSGRGRRAPAANCGERHAAEGAVRVVKVSA